MNKKILTGIVLVVVVVAGAYFIFGSSSKPSMQLETAQVSYNSINNMVTATGTVEPITEVEVGTQVSGIIDKLYVDYNDQVKAGQLIAEMDKINLQAELESAQAQLESSKTEFEYQQKNYARNKVLFEKKLISDSDYETATYTYEKAKNAYDQNKAAMVKVRRNLEYATITSPIDGVVINRAVEEGQTVAAGFETPTLFTIANDLKKMRVIADVDEADIGQVEEGQRVTFTVDAYPNDVFEGKVTQVRLEATTESNVVTYEVVINAPNEELKLKPGLTANVTIYTLERNHILAVPTKAFRFVPDAEALTALGITVAESQPQAVSGKKVIWQQNGNVLEPKLIGVGTTNGSITEVTEGLREGDPVITGMESALANIKTEKGQTEQSPFMPKPPGSDKKKK
ncbi:efflux RND transporter periplasmic adaptor subunit [Parabacteroides pacaensis]|uniref:efflux RND transporter periplasmic adaptor subunit n=1 Tax=Parabacteroides pacaensis TaxID=2086575 RepID=UPI000D0F8728|nr:efflux RND transporter periplasmic adaptor subunit [Parabacteroides pacaensis]